MEEGKDFTKIRLYLKYCKDSEVNRYAHMKYSDLYRKWFCGGFVLGLVTASVITVLVQ